MLEYNSVSPDAGYPCLTACLSEMPPFTDQCLCLLTEIHSEAYCGTYSVAWMTRRTCLTAGQHVHKSCLSSARDSHERGQHPWAEGSADAHQQLQHLLVVHGVDGRQVQVRHLLHKVAKTSEASLKEVA